jgi:hypothetical protein
MWSQAVVRFDAAGRREVVHRFTDGQPGGLGWLPDGDLVVVGMESATASAVKIIAAASVPIK